MEQGRQTVTVNDPQVNTMLIDGLPVFWVDAGERFEATLVFRAGIAHEDLPHRGTAELVHRAVLATADPGGVDITGEVDLLTSTFRCSGTPAEVLDRLRRLEQAIATVEHSVPTVVDELVQAERERRPAAEELLLRSRYGNVGVGIAPAPRLALRDPAVAAKAAAWARRHLNRANAVLVCNGPPPGGLVPGLPVGERVPLTDPAHRPRPLPACTVGPDAVVGVSLVGPPGIAFLAAVHVLAGSSEDRARDQRLFEHLALGFSRVGPHVVQALLIARGFHGRAQQTLDALVTELDRVTLHGLPVARSRAVVQELRERIADPLATSQLVRDAAVDWLLGAPPRRRQELLLELDQTTDDVVADVLWRIRDDAVWIAPADVVHDRRITPMEDWAEQSVPGTTFDQVHRDPGEAPSVVIAGPAGISLRTEGRGNLTVWWRDCVLVTVDVVGRWCIHGADGTVVEVSASRFRGPVPFAEAMAGWVPPGLVVRIEDDTVRLRPVEA
jgi:hypothetical protein